MEQEWVRQQSSVPITLAAANALLGPHGLRATSIRPFSEGKANTNVKLTLADGRASVLRLHQREKAQQLLEIALLGLFRGALPVAEVILWNSEAGWTLLEFLPGRTLEEAAKVGAEEEIVAAAPEIGKALASIAARKFDHAGFLDAKLNVTGPWPSVVDGLQGYLEMCLARRILAERIGQELTRSIERVWNAARGDLEALTTQPNLSHADFKPSNLLIRAGQLSGVLDWEFAHSGTWLMDAGQILRHRAELPPSFPTRIEAGLREGGLAVPEDWQIWAGIIDLMSLVDFLGRDECSDATVRHITGLVGATLGASQA